MAEVSRRVAPQLALLLLFVAGTPLDAQSPDSVTRILATADSLRAAGNLPAARRLAEGVEDHFPNNERAILLLGRIHLAWPVVGRWAAESLFVRAGRIDTLDPEPWYYLADVGQRLGREDGEEMKHRGLTNALARNPDYRDAWARWAPLWHNDNRRRDMIEALARHRTSVLSWYRRGQLLIESGSPNEAAAVLDSVARRQPDDPAVLAWLARALFQANRDDTASMVYDRALALAPRDTGQVLWKQVRGIATPEERERYERLSPFNRPAFYRLFWAQRASTADAGFNGRIGEHFRRLDTVIHAYSLLHPTSRYFRSATFRALAGAVGGIPDFSGGGIVTPAFEFAAASLCGESRSGAMTRSPGTGAVERIDTTNADPANLENGVDDRGMIFLRHGKPDQIFIGPHGGSETWCYHQDNQVLRVSFMRRTGGMAGTGDFVLTALQAGEPASARRLLVTDTPDERPTLTFAFWLASFRGDSGRTELAVLGDSVHFMAALLDGEGRVVGRGAGLGLARLQSRPGPHLLQVDASLDGRQNAWRGVQTVADYASDSALSLSSVLLAPVPVAATRGSMIDGVSRRLQFRRDQAVRVYSEVYGLGRAGGRSRYQAIYMFERINRDGTAESATNLDARFDRDVAAERVTRETLTLDPDRLEPGTYRLTITVDDLVRPARTRSATVQFTMR